MDLKEKIAQMSLREKATLLCGYRTMSTFPVPRLEVPSLSFSDGPNGLRVEDKKSGDSLSGISKALPATCFPSGVSLASSWNEELAYQMGHAIGEECRHYEIDMVLGPAINIKRNPLIGRNFEYYSEDPFLAGSLAGEFIQGVQDNQVGACLKHFACNNNEKNRFTGDSIVDQRALHEIYLKPFELAVRNAHPYGIMTSYNGVNGVHSSDNSYLQNDLLRKTWGFDGVSMTDWGGIVSRDTGLLGGTDLEMPGSEPHSVHLLMEKVEKGEIKEELLDQSVERILTLISKTKRPQKEADFKAHYDLAVHIAEEGAVLLKNDGSLPLKESAAYIVVGDFFKKVRYQGSGSALLNPYFFHSHEDIFNENHVDYTYFKGFKEEETKPDFDLEKEVLGAVQYREEPILFFGGLNDYVESEGFDRDNLSMPENQISLLTKLVRLGKKVIVILHNGSVISEPVLDQCSALLDMMLGGEGVSEACYHLLFGQVSPSGKLTESWVKTYGEVPFGNEFTKTRQDIYKESVFVGYRYYNALPEKVRYPFGYGLSYTKFHYSDLSIKKEKDKVSVTFCLENIGETSGKEVVQVYVSHPSSLPMPKHELKGYQKVALAPKEKKTVTIEIPFENLKIYDVNREDFVLEGGTYTFEVNSSSVDNHLSASLTIRGETVENHYSQELMNYYLRLDQLTTIPLETYQELLGYSIPKLEQTKKVDMETPLYEFHSWFGKIFVHAVSNVGLKQYNKACKMKDGPEKEREKKAGLFIYRMMPNNSLRSLSYSASGGFPYRIARGIMEMSNHHFIKGIITMMKKEK